MINNSSSITQNSLIAQGLPEMVHSILHYKYSRELIQNYEQRVFEEFSRSKDMYQYVTPEQIKGIDFIEFYSEKENLEQYCDFGKIISKIKTVVLNRVDEDHLHPMHFYGHFFYFYIRYFKEHQRHQVLQKFKKPEQTGKTTDEQILNSKQLHFVKKDSLTISTPNQKEDSKVRRYDESGEHQNESTLQDGSLTILQKINKDLSIMIKKVSKNNIKIDITACLNKMKKSIEQRKYKKVFYQTQFSPSVYDIAFDQSEESYGLNKLKKVATSAEKKKKKKGNSLGKTQANQKKGTIPQTPNPRYNRQLYGSSPTGKEESGTNRKSRNKIVKKNDSSLTQRKNKKKLKSSSKSKLQMKK